MNFNLVIAITASTTAAAAAVDVIVFMCLLMPQDISFLVACNLMFSKCRDGSMGRLTGV